MCTPSCFLFLLIYMSIHTYNRFLEQSLENVLCCIFFVWIYLVSFRFKVTILQLLLTFLGTGSWFCLNLNYIVLNNLLLFELLNILNNKLSFTYTVLFIYFFFSCELVVNFFISQLNFQQILLESFIYCTINIYRITNQVRFSYFYRKKTVNYFM